MKQRSPEPISEMFEISIAGVPLKIRKRFRMKRDEDSKKNNNNKVS